MTGCDCCCAAISVESSISYVSSLTHGCTCGFQEFIDSDPPKRYRTVSFGINRPSKDYSNPGCVTESASDIVTWSGDCTYDTSTCELVNSTHWVETNSISGTTSGSFLCTDDAVTAPDTSAGTWFTAPPVVTSTTKTWTARTDCYAPGGGSGTRLEDGGVFKKTLSNEDTAADVLARGTSTPGTDNRAWGAIWDYAGTGCPTGQFGVSAQSSDWTLDMTGLVDGCKYVVTIFYTSPGGDSTEVHTFIATGTTDTLTGSVPQVDGVITTLDHYTITAGDP
jgi:hypothetical protein